MKVMFTGGGSAGHVTPNLSLIEASRAKGWEVTYVGSFDGIEREITSHHGIPYHSVATGKLRRYFSWQNFIDPGRILLGLLQCWLLCRREKPDIIFSKGGFVAVPVVVAGWMRRIPIVIHESDMTPGLANRICKPFASIVCVTFAETLTRLPGGVLTGTPIRPSVLEGDRSRGLRFLAFQAQQPVLLIFGGSLGAAKINEALRSGLDQLLELFQVAHICGPGNLDSSNLDTAGYRQFEYLNDEFGDVLAAADLVVSRAGANSIYELLAAHKPNLLIPLPGESSRGDQIVNAAVFKSLGYSDVLEQEHLNAASLIASIMQLYRNRESRSQKMRETCVQNSVSQIIDLLASLV